MEFHYLTVETKKGMLKGASAVVLAISSSMAQAWDDGHYECTKPDGTLEYSIYKCEPGQEQLRIGGKEAPRSPARERKRPKTPAAPRTEARQGVEDKQNLELNLASYRCVGKSGDILFTDASDYLAFEIYRCTQVTRGSACAEARALAAKDPLAIVWNKLPCP